MPKAKKPDSLPKAYELLSSYVSYGAMTDDGQFDDLFEELAGLVPRETIRPIHEAFRVLVVPASDHDALAAGSPITMRAREFGSWTRSEDAARRIVRSRFLRMKDDQVVLIVRKPVERDSVVVDVQQVYRALDYDVGEVEEWGLYASWEAEVLLRQDASLLRVNLDDVRAAYRAGDPDAVRPSEGEMAWSDAEEDFVEIVDVHDEQSHREEGRWAVSLEDGTDMAVSWNLRRDSWDIAGPILAPSP